jgi:hypothetical protein
VVGAVFTAETLADLPLGGNVYSMLETTQAELIADRFSRRIRSTSAFGSCCSGAGDLPDRTRLAQGIPGGDR